MAVPAISGFAQQRGEPITPVITVVGNAEVEADPDKATVRLGVVRQATTAQLAQDQANTIAKEILAAVGRTGVTAQNIQTSRLVLSPVYAPRRPDSNDPPRIVAYNASNAIAVDLQDLALVGPVIDAGLKAGANELQGVNFGIKDDLAARERAIRQAVMEGRRKAQVIAEAMGVKLLEVLEVSEGGVSIAPKAEMYRGAPMAMLAAADVSTPVSPGQMTVSASVTIRYRIGG